MGISHFPLEKFFIRERLQMAPWIIHTPGAQKEFKNRFFGNFKENNFFDSTISAVCSTDAEK